MSVIYACYVMLKLILTNFWFNAVGPTDPALSWCIYHDCLDICLDSVLLSGGIHLYLLLVFYH